MVGGDVGIGVGGAKAVADSLLHSALTVNVSQHAVEAQRLVLNGDMEARSVTVQSGDLRVDNGVFVTSEGVSLNISSDFSVGGSVTMLPPDPATSNRSTTSKRPF